MPFVMMIVWLFITAGLVGHHLVTGRGVSIGHTGIPLWAISAGLALFNYARWYASRAGKEDEEAMRIATEARKRQNRQRPGDYDPNLDFSKADDKPPPTG